MTEKLCVFCKHFDWERFTEGGMLSDVTYDPPSGGMTCRRSHYWQERPDDTDAFRALILSADGCPDYERPAE